MDFMEDQSWGVYSASVMERILRSNSVSAKGRGLLSSVAIFNFGIWRANI